MHVNFIRNALFLWGGVVTGVLRCRGWSLISCLERNSGKRMECLRCLLPSFHFRLEISMIDPSKAHSFCGAACRDAQQLCCGIREVCSIQGCRGWGWGCGRGACRATRPTAWENYPWMLQELCWTGVTFCRFSIHRIAWGWRFCNPEHSP